MPKRVMLGTITSDRQDKTVTVRVERFVKHPVMKKYIKQSKKFAAHDEENVFKTGQEVFIEECRPISRRKTWVVIGDKETILKRQAEAKQAKVAATAEAPAEAAPAEAATE